MNQILNIYLFLKPTVNEKNNKSGNKIEKIKTK